MQEEKTEGIVLRSLDYKDRQRIITVFTQEAGMISLIVKGISSRNYRLLCLSTPFSQVEFIYRKGKSELSTFVDGTATDEHLDLREKYIFLQAAGSLGQAILHSQLPGKPSPTLYLLFRSYLKQIPTFEDPSTLIASFHLKLLKHEGLIALSSTCAHCHTQPARFLQKGESFCHAHRTLGALAFTENEWEILHLLADAQQFALLRTLKLPLEFPARIAACFQQGLRQEI